MIFGTMFHASSKVRSLALRVAPIVLLMTAILPGGGIAQAQSHLFPPSIARLLAKLPFFGSGGGRPQPPPPPPPGMGGGSGGGLGGGLGGVLDPCPNGVLPPGGASGDLEITKACVVKAGQYLFRDVNIYNGGSLTFEETAANNLGDIDFYAHSILIENNSSLSAGTQNQPFGQMGATLRIHLWGEAQTPDGPGGQGITCKSAVDETSQAPCGIDPAVWTSNGANKVTLPSNDPNNKPSDYFYDYKPLPFDGGGTPVGYFGYKVLAVSYGGSLQLFGWKGVKPGTLLHSDSGESWTRLDATIVPGQGSASTVALDRLVNTWRGDDTRGAGNGDEIVVTTTDYLPGHSEVRRITKVETVSNKTVLTVDHAFEWTHNGTRYPLGGVPTRIGLPADITAAETRAAVGLLSRSIQIVSGGTLPMTQLPDDSYFGGHTVIRQGFKTFQVDGVEYSLLGQGGRQGHYPVHFHLTRLVPPNTYIRDSAINESMTRWIAVHATQGIEISRNVGWKSIGHGFFLEDGTEINNQFYSNLGIYARAAVLDPPNAAHPQNPRAVPGIFAAPNGAGENVPYFSDVDHPTVYWIMNGWNDFQYNVAAGAGTCGVCYWWLPSWNSGASASMKWEGYASLQDPAHAATAPLKSFIGNSCSTAMTSFQTVGNTSACLGVRTSTGNKFLQAVPNPLAKSFPNSDYYPNIQGGGLHSATYCNQTDCSSTATPNPVKICNSKQLGNCAVTVLDRYETAFNWAQLNFGAMWLRSPEWILVINSIISDVQDGGLSFVTGGGYTRSDILPGHFALARRDVFIGNTQDNNPLASNAGPFVPGGLTCDANDPVNPPGNYCASLDQAISMPKDNFGQNQRLLSIYDGPMYEDSNAFLHIKKTALDCQPGACVPANTKYMNATMLGTPKDTAGACYLPNAAIAWKQPNGFFYPPAFHSVNLYFSDVDIRHFVIEPLFVPFPGTPGSQLYLTNFTAAQARYCTNSEAMFDNYSDVDRQTELSDDDGSLTGLTSSISESGETVSVNEDSFFTAPVQAEECRSDTGSATGGTAKTSPYDYLTTVEFPSCATSNPNNTGCEPNWMAECSNDKCYGVPLYRQLLTSTEMTAGAKPHILMAAQGTAQRSNLTVNNGVYYIDTTVGKARQQAARNQPDRGRFISQFSVFQKDVTYYTFFLFARPSTHQTYQMFVGKCPNPGVPNNGCFDPTTMLKAFKVDIPSKAYQFNSTTWPSTWSPQATSYDPTSGILTVTVDMNFPAFSDAYGLTAKAHCGPQSFCTWTGDDTIAKGGKCSCATSPTNPNQLLNPAECSDTTGSGLTVCDWSVADIDCPIDPADPTNAKTGCYGFGVTLPGNFATDPTPDPRPAPTCITNVPTPLPPKSDPPGFLTRFGFAGADLAGDCFNPPTDPFDFCGPPVALNSGDSANALASGPGESVLRDLLPISKRTYPGCAGAPGNRLPARLKRTSNDPSVTRVIDPSGG